MNKIWGVVIVTSLVAVLYLILLVTMPILVDATITCNSTINASSNMSLYPGTSSMVIATPWILWWVPGVIGMIIVIIILKRP